MERKIGRSSSTARAKASGPHDHQSTGLSACWRRYGEPISSLFSRSSGTGPSDHRDDSTRFVSSPPRKYRAPGWLEPLALVSVLGRDLARQPLIATDRQYHFVGPLTLDEFILDQVRLALESDLLQGADGGGISSVTAAKYAMQIEIAEADLE